MPPRLLSSNRSSQLVQTRLGKWCNVSLAVMSDKYWEVESPTCNEVIAALFKSLKRVILGLDIYI